MDTNKKTPAASSTAEIADLSTRRPKRYGRGAQSIVLAKDEEVWSASNYKLSDVSFHSQI